jgi:hypothetical protein
VANNTFDYLVSGNRSLSPLSAFLPFWDLSAEDEDALIDTVVATISENFQDVLAQGNNPDAGLVIRNSRDHVDTFGSDPYVSRVIIGGTLTEMGLDGFAEPIFAFSESVDPGNFQFDDTAVVLLDELSGMVAGNFNHLFDLNRVPLKKDSKELKIKLVGTAIGNIASHEVGHNLGSYHTHPGNFTLGIMDNGHPLGFKFSAPAVGADGVFGTHDDEDRDFGVDVYSQGAFEGVGVNETINTTAFGLSIGKAQALHAEHLPLVASEQLLTPMIAEPLLRQAVSYWERQGAPTEALGSIALHVADLPDTQIGRAYRSTITIDSNAAGWGWTIDAHAIGGSMDLLSTLTHEVGHLLGYDHADSGFDVMASSLRPGSSPFQTVGPELQAWQSDFRLADALMTPSPFSENQLSTRFSLGTISIDATRVMQKNSADLPVPDTIRLGVRKHYRILSVDLAIAMLYREQRSVSSDDVWREDDLLDLVIADVFNE